MQNSTLQDEFVKKIDELIKKHNHNKDYEQGIDDALDLVTDLLTNKIHSK